MDSENKKQDGAQCDGDVMVFMRQGIRITNALKAAQDALDAEAPSNGQADRPAGHNSKTV
jgi:hypothetical protein